ncbi:hypothetical protein IFM89_029329 [Coptis chinensis]|uniref:Uncharacterized protein n=1 Tax=Coptis chinensis TaxID=261450 RepID=A0A835M7F2_9MAGN|nr:hypothetical protein IFM89_029329 [Coptis chinensis]
MAFAHCPHSASTTTFPPSSPSSVLITRKTISSLPLYSKPTKRKNHLRPKLLKTLTKPFPTYTPLLNPQQQVPTPQNIEKIETLIEQEEEEEEEENVELALDNVQVSAAPEMEPVISKRSVVELVFYLVGLFVVQTVITVWILRSGDVDKNKDENEEMLSGEKMEVECNESVGYVDELGVKEKIVEIRAMAREVREIEAKKLSSSNESVSDVSVSKSVVTKVNTNIQKEVDGKLNKLEKRLRSLREKLPVAKVGYLNNSINEVKNEKELGRLNGNSKDENLVFKKKLKFKSDSSKPRNSPKGFPGVKNHNLSDGNDRSSGSQDAEFRKDVIKNSARGMSVNLPNGGSHGSTHENEVKTLLKLARKDEEKSCGTKLVSTGKSLKKVEGMKTEKRNSRSGVVRESKEELVEPRDSNKMKTKSSPIPKTNVQFKEVVDNARDKQEYIENDAWWLSLPYALAILLRRSSESDGPGGLYSLKMDDGSPSYIVAFEDQRDASNFCYILEAFFDELGDLKADVVPLSIKELRDEVETMTMKIIVLRKGQLQLYAGQPLVDVEMTLRTLIKQ